MSPSRKREAVRKLTSEFGISERRACRVLDQPRASQRYQITVRGDEAALVKRMLELARKHPRYGYRFITAKLRQEGWPVNRKRVYRLWRREGLKVPQKKRKKRRLGTSENACHRRRAERKDHVWCWDFIFDRTASGSPLKWLSIEDEYTRECLCLKVARSITSEDVIDTLAELFAMRGVPEHIRSDNGPEFNCSCHPALAGARRSQDAQHRAGSAVGEWLRRELPQPLPRRILGQRSVRELGGGEKAHHGLERRLQPPPAAQFAGVPDPGRIRGPLHCFRSEVAFGYASSNFSAPAVQRNHPTRTLIATGTEFGGRPDRIIRKRLTIHTSSKFATSGRLWEVQYRF